MPPSETIRVTSDRSRTFSYDAENRLRSVVSGSVTVNLSYDPFGRLESYTAGGAVTRFRYAGQNLAVELMGTTAMRDYVSGPGWTTIG